nr:hypothetical protein [Tanacetum cinerariifolium]
MEPLEDPYDIPFGSARPPLPLYQHPILESKDDLVLKLIDDLDEALIVIESDGMVKKNEIYVAPVAIAPVE